MHIVTKFYIYILHKKSQVLDNLNVINQIYIYEKLLFTRLLEI